MKMLIGMVLTLGIMLFAARFMLEGGNIPGFSMPGMNTEKAAKGLGELGNAVTDENVTVYKWVDEKGVTHFGEAPPTGHPGSYDKKEIHANTKIVQAHKIAEEEEETEGKPKIAKVGKLYTPEGVSDLLKDTKGLQEQLNQRVSEQQKLMDSINNGKK